MRALQQKSNSQRSEETQKSLIPESGANGVLPVVQCEAPTQNTLDEGAMSDNRTLRSLDKTQHSLSLKDTIGLRSLIKPQPATKQPSTVAPTIIPRPNTRRNTSKRPVTNTAFLNDTTQVKSSCETDATQSPGGVEHFSSSARRHRKVPSSTSSTKTTSPFKTIECESEEAVMEFRFRSYNLNLWT
ncbi:unnamed protein product [Toxocara canis]|uniref:Uncharacterized protein n=1 Tax=Toxocara canis TaxID=6265 RepID=A0A183UTT8_TOXCA|nr:unnamed protein product [Toxocara canis]